MYNGVSRGRRGPARSTRDTRYWDKIELWLSPRIAAGHPAVRQQLLLAFSLAQLGWQPGSDGCHWDGVTQNVISEA